MNKPNSPRTAAIALFAFCILHSALISQPNFNANNYTNNYSGNFRPGYNPSFAAGWSDLDFANLAAGNPALYMPGTGLKSIRDGLFFEDLRVNGYDSKLPEIQHYQNVGLGDLTMLLVGGENGFEQHPTQAFRDQTFYCADHQSELFANLYTPIWDGGANGTPYNDENYFAAYLYQTVLNYRDYVQFWEIWNEPGFDFSGQHGWREPGDPVGNWWDANPDPCDYKLHAPVTHYVRMLRIAWDVVKTLDPTAFVCMGAPGFPSFVDAVARNTDNPVDGSVSAEFPLKGGAYFDAMCFHSFPHFDNSLLVPGNPPKYVRNSDVAADGTIKLKDSFEKILKNYGYDGTVFPKKNFLITEINLPRKIFDYQPFTYGNQLGQRNFMMKAFINSKIAGIKQMHVYTISELRTEATAGWEFDLMGLYPNLDSVGFNAAFPLEPGIGIHTMSDLIFNTEHDPAKSALLQTDPNVRAEAFKKPDGSYVYALWAKMQQDFSELGTVNYSFPAAANVSPFLRKYLWTKSITGLEYIIQNHDIVLDGTPVFFTEETDLGQPLPGFTAAPRSGCVPFLVNYSNISANADTLKWAFEGGDPLISNEENPVVTYSLPGLYATSLTATNALVSNVNSQIYYLTARTAPTASFEANVIANNAFFVNYSQGADSYFWEFGDGATSTEVFPNHDYPAGGNYVVRLTATNACGSTVFEKTIAATDPLFAGFTANQTVGCAPMTVNFTNTTVGATNFFWEFPGGFPATSDLENPVISYNSAGNHDVRLTCWNSLTGGKNFQTNFIHVGSKPVAGFDFTKNGLVFNFQNLTSGATETFWDFGDGQQSMDSLPTHIFQNEGSFWVKLVTQNDCGADSFSIKIDAFLPPAANFLAVNSTGCVPLTVNFSSASSGANTFNWFFEGGDPATSSAQNPVVTYSLPGIYDVSLRVENPAGKDSLLKNDLVIVKQKPIAGFAFGQMGQTLFFENMSQFGTAYQWNFGDFATSAEYSPEHTFAMPGTYFISLAVANECGVSIFSDSITVFGSQLIPDFSADKMAGCTPFEVHFSDKSTGATSWAWTFLGGTPPSSTDQNPTVIYELPGTFPATLVIKNAADSAILTIDTAVVVGAKPVADFSYQQSGDTVFFQNNSQFENTLIWDFGDGTTGAAANPFHVFGAGDFTIKLTVENDCGTADKTLTIKVLSSNNFSVFENKFTLEPNPSDGIFKVKIDGNLNATGAFLEMTDVSGQAVFSKKMTGQETEIDARFLPSGVYFLKISDGEFWGFRRVVLVKN